MTVSEEMKKKNDAGTKPAENPENEKPEACGNEAAKAEGTKCEEAGDKAPDGKSSEAEAEKDSKAAEKDGEAAGKAGSDKTGETGESAGSTEDAAAEDEALMAKYQRLMADFQNYKRRTEKEKSDIYAYANEKLIVGLLEVIDNFERAVLSDTADKKYAEGMEMIFRQLKSVLEKSGLEEIKALGEGFDPNFHNAVMTEDNDQFESGSVTEVLQKGYTLNGKVIRPSMVKVNN